MQIELFASKLEYNTVITGFVLHIKYLVSIFSISMTSLKYIAVPSTNSMAQRFPSISQQ